MWGKQPCGEDKPEDTNACLEATSGNGHFVTGLERIVEVGCIIRKAQREKIEKKMDLLMFAWHSPVPSLIQEYRYN